MTDELELKAAWMAEAQKQTMVTIGPFLKKLAAHTPSYGTTPRAVAAAAVGAAWALDSSPNGGITGFQAGCVMWDFIQSWHGTGDRPMQLIDFQDALYPQYHERFTTMSKDTWEWLQKEAAASLAKDGRYVHADVHAHWQSIVDGVVPFGLSVRGG